jgi:hypothetical protein
MKRLALTILLVCLGAFTFSAFAANPYPYTNPTYLPNSVATPVTLSAPGDVVLTNSGSGTVAIDIRGTCTSLAGVLQESVDGTNYITVNVFPVTTGSITAAASITAAGTWRANIAGSQSVKIHITALTASCTFSAVAAPQSFTGTY